MDKSVVTNEINQKPTTKLVEGNKQDGFLYRVSWFLEKPDGVIANDLECANMKFDKNITDKLVQLARKIDGCVAIFYLSCKKPDILFPGRNYAANV